MKHFYCWALSCLLAGPTLAQTPAVFSPVATYNAGAGSAPNAIAVADVNADGKPDLLTANYGSNTSNMTGTLLNATTFLAGSAVRLASSVTLAHNPARSSTLLGVTGLPTVTRTLNVTLLNSVG